MSLESLSEERKRYLLIGDITTLFLRSNYHKNFPIINMFAVVVEPLTINQCKIYYNNKNLPIAFVSWAWVSNVISEKYQKGDYLLQPNEWKSGEHLWIMDFIAPYGHTRKIVADLYENVFGREQKANFLRRNPDGSVKSFFNTPKNTSDNITHSKANV